MWWPALLACAPDRTPTWAWDPIWLEPTPEEGAHGFQTWQLYGPEWASRPDDRLYACAVVVELEGEPVACDTADCERAWSIVPTLLETDCAGDLGEAPLFLTLRALAIGGRAPDDEAAWPGLTSIGLADYGDGWQPHGQAYVEALDRGGEGALGWTGEDPFLFVPDAAVPLLP